MQFHRPASDKQQAHTDGEFLAVDTETLGSNQMSQLMNDNDNTQNQNKINNIYYIAHTVHIPPFHALCTNSRAQASLSITSSREGCAMYAAASTAFII